MQKSQNQNFHAVKSLKNANFDTNQTRKAKIT